MERPAVILLAEDDLGDQELTRRALAEGKIKNELHIVQDGEEAIDYLFRRGKYTDPETSPWPDLFLLDLNMPKIDGRRVLAEIKTRKDLPHLAIVVLTTSSQEEDILRSYDLGVKSFITKPVDFTKFIDLIHALENYWFQVVVLPKRGE
ncbi:response regulator [Desulfobacula toluolica]|uniref:Two component system response regulator n=1 Tax=Desulfobacula toluolica (strain DSM 7467 / Tol2) TaxID=651182 RepID=K0NKM8_DESTT|nr:response regulator [Desulfobacula toluolica]CCK79302.1 two component system response regulator [Desulfobacula toluolica Tol2]